MRRSVSLGVAGALVLVSAGVLTASPVSAEQVGTDDIKLTTGADPRDAEVSYDPVNDRHLLVWDEVTAGGERIRGQIVTAAGAVFAGPFDIASPPVTGGIAADPAVTWDSSRNRWVVAYVTDETNLGARDIAVATVTAAGVPAVVGLVSDMGDTAGDGTFDAAEPDIAFNATTDQFLVVWRGDDNSTANGEDEIFGQRLAGNTVAEVNTDFRVSTTGANGDTNIDARRPSLAWNPGATGYAVVYEQLTGLVPQAVFANSISATGNPGAAVEVAAATAGVERGHPAIAANGTDYGVVWEAYTTATGISQIEGRLLTSAVAASTAFPALSTPGVDASGAEIAADDTNDRFGLVWDSNTGTEREIFGAILSATATISEPVSRLSTMGVNGTASTIPVTPSIAIAATGSFLTIWESDNVDAAAAPNNTTAGDIEIFGQRFQITAPPSVTVNQAAGQPDPTNANSVQFTAVFDKAVTGFGAQASDVTLTGAGAAGATVSVTGGPTTYTITVGNLTADGPITASVPANAAVDGSAQGNTASTSTDNTITRDTVAPTVTTGLAAGQPTPTNAATAAFTATFSENVTGFATGDVTIDTTGTAAGTVSAVTGGPSIYTVTVSGLSGTGTLGIRVSAGGAADAAGNGNTASAAFLALAVDRDAPTVTVNQAAGQADPTNTEPISFTAVFSEAVTGFDATDVTIGGTAPGILSAVVTGTGPTYTVSVQGVTGSGTVTASIAAGGANDAVGNANAASTSADNSVTYDATRPGVSLVAVTTSPTNATSLVTTVTVTEPVTGLTVLDVAVAPVGVTFANVSLVPSGPTTYTLTVGGVSGDGTLQVSIPANAAQDAAGNVNTASNVVTFTIDQTAPTATVIRAAGAPNPTNASTLPFTVNFSEAVTGVDLTDFTLVLAGTGSGTVQSVTGGPSTYTVTVANVTGDGTVRLDLNGAGTGIADLAGNAAAGATGQAFTVDQTRPTVTVEQAAGQPDPVNTAPVSFTVTFTEAVTGFDAADVDLSTSTTPGSLVATVSGTGTTYTVDVTGMTGPGTVIATVGAGAAADAATNTNTASTSTDNVVTFDGTPPTVTVEQAVGQADPTNATPITFTVTFSEPVTGFAAADVVLGGTAGATTALVSGAGASFTVDVSGMTGVGTVTASVVAGAAVDNTGNASLASTSGDNTVTYVPGDPTPGVNDPPTFVAPATIAAELGVALAMNGTRAVTVVDPDAFNDPISVTIGAPNATFAVAASPGTTVTGAGTGSVTLVGTQAAINTALGGLSVTFTETGPITITMAADDQGNSPAPARTATATIAATVVDTTPPVITVPAATVVADNDLGRAGAIVTYPVTVSDAGRPNATNRALDAAPPTFTCTPASGSFFPLGRTTVSCTAQDAAGNSSTATFQVQVDDRERPVITVPGTQQVGFRGAATSGVVTYPAPTATDNSGQVTVSCTPASGSTFQAGSTTVTCTATDPSGNTATGTFLVQASSGNLPITGGGTNLVPSALAVLLAGVALVMLAYRRRRPYP